MKTISVVAHVEIPTVPNFLMMSDGQRLSIAAVTEEGLKEIGKEWTLALVNKARDKRKESK